MMHRINRITTTYSPKQIYGKLVKNIYVQIKLRIVSVQRGGKQSHKTKWLGNIFIILFWCDLLAQSSNSFCSIGSIDRMELRERSKDIRQQIAFEVHIRSTIKH